MADWTWKSALLTLTLTLTISPTPTPNRTLILDLIQNVILPLFPVPILLFNPEADPELTCIALGVRAGAGRLYDGVASACGSAAGGPRRPARRCILGRRRRGPHCGCRREGHRKSAPGENFSGLRVFLLGFRVSLLDCGLLWQRSACTTRCGRTLILSPPCSKCRPRKT